MGRTTIARRIATIHMARMICPLLDGREVCRNSGLKAQSRHWFGADQLVYRALCFGLSPANCFNAFARLERCPLGLTGRCHLFGP